MVRHSPNAATSTSTSADVASTSSNNNKRIRSNFTNLEARYRITGKVMNLDSAEPLFDKHGKPITRTRDRVTALKRKYLQEVQAIEAANKANLQKEKST